MDFDAALDKALNRLHDEGRYRTFIDIERQKGHFPHAVWTRPDGTQKPITVWCCSNSGKRRLTVRAAIGPSPRPITAISTPRSPAPATVGAGSEGFANVDDRHDR